MNLVIIPAYLIKKTVTYLLYGDPPPIIFQQNSLLDHYAKLNISADFQELSAFNSSSVSGKVRSFIQ